MPPHNRMNSNNILKSDLSDNVENSITVRLEVFVIHEDYKERPPIYFLTLRKSLRKLQKGFRPDAFVKIDFSGKKSYITQREFEKDAVSQYASYADFTHKVQGLYARHFGKNSNTYKEIEEKYHLDSSFNENTPVHKRKHPRRGGTRANTRVRKSKHNKTQKKH